MMVYSAATLATLTTATLLGWGTNVLAIKMLTRPEKPIRIGPFKLHGLIPSRLERFAESIATLVVQNLTSGNELLSALDTGHMGEALQEAITLNLVEYIYDGKAPTKAAVNAVVGITKDILKDFAIPIPAEALQDKQIQDMITKKILAMPMSQLHSLVHGTAKHEFKFIEAIGACIGFIVGLFQIIVF